MSILDRPKNGVYRLHQSVWSAWARRRYRAELAAVERFLLFVGYPRSGHSIVGALLNAHRDAVVAHELDAPPLIVGGCSRDELFSRILARAYWFNMRGNRANYPYAVPGQWQGRFETLRVIGDKRGGSVTHTLADHPDFFERVRSLVGIPLRLVHVHDHLRGMDLDVARLQCPEELVEEARISGEDLRLALVDRGHDLLEGRHHQQRVAPRLHGQARVGRVELEHPAEVEPSKPRWSSRGRKEPQSSTTGARSRSP